MSVQEVINIFSSNACITFLTEYIANKALDKVITIFGHSINRTGNIVGQQLVNALEESLENFCKLMDWEYDSKAITDTYIYTVTSLNGINSQDTLKSILENAIGTEIDNTQLDIWITCFKLSIVQLERTELFNYLVSNNILKLDQDITNLENSIADMKKIVIEESMKILQELRYLKSSNLVADDIYISVFPFNTKEGNTFEHKQNELELEYVYSRNNSEIKINPSMKYLDKLNFNEPITQITYLYEPFSWNLPSLDFKLVNNTNNTLFITEIIFKNIVSSIDLSPVLTLPVDNCYANARHIAIKNEGWGKIKNLKVRLSVRSRKGNHKKSKLSHELWIGTVDRERNIDISQVLLDYKLIPNLYSLKPPKYEIDIYNFAIAYGEFIYEGEDCNGHICAYTTKFETVVYLYNWNLPAMPPPPSYYYNVKFETNNQNYTVYKSVAHILKPKDYDRFVITLGIDKSSYHNFEIQIVTNLGIVTLPNVSLHAFIPRSSKEFIRTNKVFCNGD